jgi:hypothetical protein
MPMRSREQRRAHQSRQGDRTFSSSRRRRRIVHARRRGGRLLRLRERRGLHRRRNRHWRRTARARHMFRVADIERGQQRPTRSSMLRVVVAGDFLIVIGVAAKSLEQISDVV